MPSYAATPTPPNQDKRWKLVDATIRRQGQQQRGLIETLHTVQEAFAYLDEQALRYVAMPLRVPLSRAYGVALLPFLHAEARGRAHQRRLHGHGVPHHGSAATA